MFCISKGKITRNATIRKIVVIFAVENMRNYLINRPAKDILAAIVFCVVVCVLVLSAIWAYRQFISTPPYVDPEKYPIKGIDISRHNGKIDFEKVKDDGIEFVFIKASEGETHIDSLFNHNFENARLAGLKVGAYHFFRFDKDGVQQAVNFLSMVGSRRTDLGLVVDVEKTGNPTDISAEEVRKNLSAMVDYMNLLGHRVMIYTNYEGYYEYISEILPGYPLWICRFRENPINAEWTFWQFDHHGKVNGIKGDVDLNVFCGKKEEWERFLNGDIWPYTGN
ncbi:MAG: hypothetical protein J1E95_01050 [Muribaculaceae bacterium]|nr:hypothetical protein [Muribaculaceae bacterium]